MVIYRSSERSPLTDCCDIGKCFPLRHCTCFVCGSRGQRRNEESAAIGFAEDGDTSTTGEKTKSSFCFFRYGAEQNELWHSTERLWCRIQAFEGQQGQSTLSSPPEDLTRKRGRRQPCQAQVAEDGRSYDVEIRILLLA